MWIERPFSYVTLVFLLIVSFAVAPSMAQSTASDGKTTQDAALAETVKQLQEQVKELRSIVLDLRTESERYHAEAGELRQELHSAVAPLPQQPAPEILQSSGQSSGQPEASQPNSNSTQESKINARQERLEEQYELLTGKIDDQYQTKVESGSKYKVRLSGLLLMNVFSNRGGILNADLPGLVDAPDALGRSNSTGFSLRQSQIGLEVFGPEIAGAKTHGELQADFAGGFPSAPNGVVFGLMRLRTATIHLDWQHTSVVAVQDTP